MMVESLTFLPSLRASFDLELEARIRIGAWGRVVVVRVSSCSCSDGVSFADSS